MSPLLNICTANSVSHSESWFYTLLVKCFGKKHKKNTQNPKFQYNFVKFFLLWLILFVTYLRNIGLPQIYKHMSLCFYLKGLLF